MKQRLTPTHRLLGASIVEFLSRIILTGYIILGISCSLAGWAAAELMPSGWKCGFSDSCAKPQPIRF